MNQLLPRHVHERQQYRKNRYMRHLTQAELEVRISDIFINILLLNNDAQITTIPVHLKSSQVMFEKWTHVLEEMVLRYGPYPSGFRAGIVDLPDFTSTKAELAVEKLKAHYGKDRNVLVRYGKLEHMELLLIKGGLRLQPASSFNQSIYNSAVRDDELNLDMAYVLSRDDVIKIVKNPQDVPEKIPDQRVNVKHFVKTDYWMYCLTTSVNPRLFVDFNAEACVIFHEHFSLANRLKATADKVMSDTKFLNSPVRYIDPIVPTLPIPDVPLSKHFRYTYQSEYRNCWIPKTPGQKLEHIDLELGSFEKEAELLVL